MNTKTAEMTAAVQGWVERTVRPLLARLKALEDRPAPVAVRGDPGQNGKDATIDQTMLRLEVERVVSAIPKAEPGRDGKDVPLEVVAALVAGAVADRVAALPAPKDGNAGKDFDPAALVLAVERAVAALPKAKDGDRGTDGTSPDEATIVERVTERVLRAIPTPKDPDPDTMTQAVARAVAALPKPIDGENGRDVDQAAVEALIERRIAERVAALPPAKNGQDGVSVDEPAIQAAALKRVEALAEETLPLVVRKAVSDRLEAVALEWQAKTALLVPPGRDGLSIQGRAGTSVDPEDVREMVRAAVDRIPPARDGRDGFTLDDLTAELKDGRTLLLTLRSDDRTVTREVHLAGLPIYRGIYGSAKTYDAGDMATYGGSVWMAQKQTGEAPKGPTDSWRLVVKGGK